jgi:peptide/nickel transport system permease protein
VLAYVIRRLLLMIPTFLGILVINFGVLRLQSSSLSEAMSQQVSADRGGGGDGGGGRKSQSSYTAVENHLARFRRTGNDLPALINTRGFLDKEDVLSLLSEASQRTGHASRRTSAETRLWLLGHDGVRPLADVLADDELAEWHGAASVALTFCAFVPLNAEDLPSLGEERRTFVQTRNAELRKLRMPDGVVDPDYVAKRARLLALVDASAEEFVHTPGRAARQLLFETGFIDFLAKLSTLNLYSETRNDYVFNLIGERWYVTFWLNLFSIVIAWVGSIGIGIRSARRIGTLEDRVTTQGLFLLWSVPSFFIGTLMLHHLCANTAGGRAWFPNRGLSSDGSLWMSTPRYLLDLAWHAFLPLVVLCYASFTSLSRYMRGNLLEQLGGDYVRTARAKGASEDAIVYRHALPNSLIIMITLGAGLLAELFSGVLIVEYIFSIPGLGLLLLDAARQNDAPLVMGATVIQVGLLLIGMLCADLLYAAVDPRIRSAYG